MNNNYFDNIADQIAIGHNIDAFEDEWSQLCVDKWERGDRVHFSGPVHELVLGPC